MNKDQIADLLDEVALLLELKGENVFKVRAYRQGAEVVRFWDGDIVALAREDRLKGIKGLGESLRQQLHELVTQGEMVYHQALKAEFPSGLFELFELQGLGPKKIKVLYDSLRVVSIADLKMRCESGEVANLPGFGLKTQSKMLEAIAFRTEFSDQFLLGDVGSLVQGILEYLQSHSEVLRSTVAGSFRRAKESVHDLDFLVATAFPDVVCEYFTQLPEVATVLVCGNTKASVRLRNGIQCDLRAVSNAEFPFALLYFTGSKEHNVALRSLALKKGLSLNEYGFSVVDGVMPSDLHDERDIYECLGLNYIAPELRENHGEIEAALKGDLPCLIELESLRGTFHSHTTESDGMEDLASMADEAMELGLEYLGISDHSKSTSVANGLNEVRLLRQIEEIRSLNQTFTHFRLFAGSEVDILKDGSLDFDDELLGQLDFCVASVHQWFDMSESDMTKRICRVMENPHVTMIGHLTGRKLFKRSGYAVDHMKIIDCAAETRTVIELNCNPRRLDMDWRWWKRARDLGVLCSINPDAHSRDALHHLGIGVRVARKGWLRREDVLNTLSVGEVEAFLNTPKFQRVYQP